MSFFIKKVFFMQNNCPLLVSMISKNDVTQQL